MRISSAGRNSLSEPAYAAGKLTYRYNSSTEAFKPSSKASESSGTFLLVGGLCRSLTRVVPSEGGAGEKVDYEDEV